MVQPLQLLELTGLQTLQITVNRFDSAATPYPCAACPLYCRAGAIVHLATVEQIFIIIRIYSQPLILPLENS